MGVNTILLNRTALHWTCPPGTEDILLASVPGFPDPTEEEVEAMLIMLARFLDSQTDEEII